jgi:hypothetical protein
MFPRDKQVGDLLEHLKRAQSKPELCAVFLGGVLLDNGDSFDEWYKPEHIFQVTNSRTERPEPIGSGADNRL